MADFNSSLPVRTQNNGDVVAFLADSTTNSILDTIKAASTAAVATDTALVVTMSPNTPLPAGTNLLGSVNQGTSPWITLDQADGSATGGTAAAYSSLSGGIYNSTPPTLTNGQQASLQLTSAGALIVSATVVFPYDTNYGTVDATTLRVASQIGNATGAANFGAGATTAQTLRVASNLYDGSGNALSSTSGALNVSLTTAIPAGSNNIGSVNQGTSPWIVKDQADGPVTPGTVASFSQLAGGQYNSTPPSLTTGQQVALQVDAAGRLLVDANITFPYDENWGTVGATTLRTAAQIGNATGAADFNWGTVGAQTLRVASEIGNATGAADFGAGNSDAQTLRVVIATNQSAIPVTQSTSPWITQDTSDGSVTGGTAGTTSMLGGGIYNATPPTLTNGQQASLQLDSSGNLKVDLATPIPAGTNLIGAVNLDIGGSTVSATNPVPVSIVSTTPGTAIQNYQTFVNLAAGATHTFTYTVAVGHTFNLYRVWSAGSGKIKSLVQNNGTTIFVGFNSTANPNIDMTVAVPPLIAAGNTVTVAITNNDLMAFDVYVTVEGNQN